MTRECLEQRETTGLTEKGREEDQEKGLLFPGFEIEAQIQGQPCEHFQPSCWWSTASVMICHQRDNQKLV